MDVVEVAPPAPPQEAAAAPAVAEGGAPATAAEATATAAAAAPMETEEQEQDRAPAAVASAVVREAQAFFEKLALHLENRAVPAEGERAEVRRFGLVSREVAWMRRRIGKEGGRFGSAHTDIILYTPYNTQHGASGRWSGPMTAAEVSRLYRELLRLRDGGPGAYAVLCVCWLG